MTTHTAIRYNNQGLIPCIAQQQHTGEVLMHAWMDAEALALTMQTGQMHYWSRSRQSLWRKGESSGHTQRLISLALDCDGDTLLAVIEQTGPACHTGAPTCFFEPLWSVSEKPVPKKLASETDTQKAKT